jgi:hypothetical protein
VAETHRWLFVTRLPMMTTEQVVAASLDGLDKGRERAWPAWRTACSRSWCRTSRPAASLGASRRASKSRQVMSRSWSA